MTVHPATRLGVLALLLAPAPAAAQQTFEGVIAYRLTAEGRSVTMRQMSKGSMTRTELEMPGMPPGMYMLLDGGRQVMQVVMGAMGMYMEMDLSRATAGAQTAAVPKITKLGTSATIAGVPCEDYRFGEGAEEVEVCVATGLGFFMSPNMPGPGGRGGPTPNMGPDLSAYRSEFKDGMVPLRMKTKVNGEWTVMMEASEVSRKALDAGLFRLPDGLRKMPMPGG